MDVREVERWPAGLFEEWAAFYSFEGKMRAKAEAAARREAKQRR